jgi:Flp pilus assembly protein TadG
MRNYKASKGQSLVEFALVFPLFFFMVTGLLDLGRAVFAYTTMNTAVREGTRYAIVQLKGTPDTDIEAVVRSYFYDLKDFDDNTVVTVSRVGDADNPKVNIHVAYTFEPVTPGMKQILSGGKTILIEAESEMFIAPIGK